MTYIPRKDEYQNNEEPYAQNQRTSQDIDLIELLKQPKFISAMGWILGNGFIWINGLSMYSSFSSPVMKVLQVIINSFFAVLITVNVLNYFLEKGFRGFLADIINFIANFFGDIKVDPDAIKKSIEDDARKYNERVEQSKKDYGYYESLKKPDDGKDFNTRQKEERRARAYAKADPEFEVSYKSKGGAWVRDIVRGRDKAEVLNRYRHNPMVEIMGGVVGIDE